MKIITFFLFLIISCQAHSQTWWRQKQFEDWQGYDEYWDKVHKFHIRGVYDSAFYSNGSICYVKSVNDTSSYFIKYFPSGEIHVEGKNMYVKGKRITGRTGNWKIYYPGETIKEVVSYRMGRKYGLYQKYDEYGELKKEKVYDHRLKSGFSVGVFLGEVDLSQDAGSNIRFKNAYGFELGLFLSYDLTGKLSLRSLLNQSFQTYNFSSWDGRTLEEFSLDYAYLKLPVSLTYKIYDEIYLLAGVSNNIRNNYKTTRKLNRDTFSTRDYDLSAEVGVGYQFKFRMFELLPELRWSKQLNDWSMQSDAVYSKSVTEMSRSQFTFTLIARA